MLDDHFVTLRPRQPVWMHSAELLRRVAKLAVADSAVIKLEWDPHEGTGIEKGTKTQRISRSAALAILDDDEASWAGQEALWSLSFRNSHSDWSIWKFIEDQDALKTILTFTPRRGMDHYVAQVLAAPDAGRMIDVVIAGTFLRSGELLGQVRARLDAGLDPNYVIEWSGEKRSLISLAAAATSRFGVEALLERGANPSGPPGTVSPLFYVNSHETLTTLLKAGSDPAAKNAKGQTPDKFWKEDTWKLYEHMMLVYARQRKTGGARFPWANKDFLMFVLGSAKHRLYKVWKPGIPGSSNQGWDVVDMPLPEAEAWLEGLFDKLDWVEPSKQPEWDGQMADDLKIGGLWGVSFRADSIEHGNRPSGLTAFVAENPDTVVRAWKERRALQSLPASAPAAPAGRRDAL